MQEDTRMNLPPKQPDKRIVSKGEYARLRSKQVGLGVVSIFLMLIMVVAGFAAIVLAIFLLPLAVASYFGSATSATVFLLLLLAISLGVSAYFAGKWGNDKFIHSLAINPGIPLTRANTADLPAPDSLVRASEELRQAQQATLLRPAAQYGEAHEDQLLKASIGRGSGA